MRTIGSPIRPGVQVSMGTMLTRQAIRDPDRNAVTVGERTLTYGELESDANRRAREFQLAGARKDDLIAISLQDRFEFHATTFAAWKIGATPAPLSDRLAKPELNAILEVMAPSLTVGLPSLETKAAFQTGWKPDPSIEDGPLPDCISTYWKANTSGGSTGRPKVIVQHRPSSVDPSAPSNGLVLEDTILVPAPLYHSAPFSFTNLALCWGAHVIEMEQFDPAETLRLIERHRVRWLYLVPTMMHRISSMPEDIRSEFDLSSLEMVLHMAAPCPPWLKQAWIDWLGPDRIWEAYGGTEAVGGTVLSGREWLDHKGSVGRPYFGSLKIVDDDGLECKPGQIGEISFLRAEGSGAAYHYLGSEPNGRAGMETYGDMGWVDTDGYLYIADRRTDMILSGGVNLYPAETEAALEEYASIASCVCIGMPDADLGQRMHAIIELRPNCRAPSAKELQEFLSERLARHKIPFTYEISKSSLRNEVGKVRRSALRDQRISERRSGGEFVSLRAVPQSKP